ncbi:hypothetical protein HX798_21525 [Pseudomonas putida]|uniref:Trypsin-like peptidase domain-containing protein n=1 Tax=Pseudomonas putida TaxID=303 RepID=A0A7Y8D3N8_PSEPU|nr:hypothetical protein [Pseudomonas putida]NWC82849.1 hypothetical protein [Pseudomonas putida]
MTPFPKHSGLVRASRYVAAIAAGLYRPERGYLPTPSEPTATVTFVRFEGEVYALTAKHVVLELDKWLAKSGRLAGAYFCPANRGFGLSGPFISPPALFPQRNPDVALLKVTEKHLSRLGKEAFEILPETQETKMPWPPTHGRAYGFPTVDKNAVIDALGERLAMPSVEVVAECISTGSDSDQIQFHSELSEPVERGSLSGLSGGAVFWSTDEQYGLAGIVKEAFDVNPKEGEESFYTSPKVNFVCQRIDYTTMARWVDHYNLHWQSERNKLNHKAREQNEREIQARLDHGRPILGNDGVLEGD